MEHISQQHHPVEGDVFAAGGSPGEAPAKATTLAWLPEFLKAYRSYCSTVNLFLETISRELGLTKAAYLVQWGDFAGQLFLSRGGERFSFLDDAAEAYREAQGLKWNDETCSACEHRIASGFPWRLVLRCRGAKQGGLLILERENASGWSEADVTAARDVCASATSIMDIAADFEELKRQTRHDFITGLFNRLYFEQILPMEVERAARAGSSFSLAFMDLDGFKRFNDTYGHQRGDELLKRIGQILGDAMRRSDIATRYGGDEFGLIFPNTSPDQAKVILKRIREKIIEAGNEFGKEVPVGASFGLSYYPGDGEEPVKLIEIADSRLYKAKSRLKRIGRGPRNG